MDRPGTDPARTPPSGDRRLRVRCDDRLVAVFASGTAARRRTAAVGERGRDAAPEAGEAARTGSVPDDEGLTVVLTDGLLLDPGFVMWARTLPQVRARLGAGAPDHRRDVLVDLHDGSGRRVRTWRLARARVSDLVPLPAGPAAGAVPVRSMTLEHEGVERVHQPVEPVEPGEP